MSKNKPINTFRRSLPYIGNKFRLLSQLLPHFPTEINNFIEPFTGGGTIPLNIEAKYYHLNDINKYVIKLHEYILNYSDIEDFISLLKNEIEVRGLSQTNQEAYLKLRSDYNNFKQPHLFFLLICYTFNNQIRFNKKEQFNSPFGERCFNSDIESNLRIYHNTFFEKSIYFNNLDFEEFLDRDYKENDFIYLDPPYLVSNATYNGECKMGGWGTQNEITLYNTLDKLNPSVKWCLSNVVENKGVTNEILLEWSKKYVVIDLEMDYSNSYASRKKTSKSKEVLVKNY
jgi:DNA adenine methylase Dam